jgi:hypothetical protein
MNMKTLLFVAISIVILLLAVGVAGAVSDFSTSTPLAGAAEVSSGISYQGRLTDPEGVPLNGKYTLRFVVYDASVAGASLWDSGDLDIDVENGLFNVKLGVNQAAFNGQALWLSLIVDGQTLSPRQEILPAPYALSLRPGADVVGEPPAWNDSILDVEMTGNWPSARAGGFFAPSTGTAIYADGNGGVGVFGDSENSYGVWGSSNNSWGGFFASGEGLGLRVDTNGSDIYDYGAHITSEWGYGVYAQSTSNQAIRGEAGNITGLDRPFGTVGVTGIGSSRGVYGSSGNGSGVYGTSDNNYGVWGQSETYRGVTGRTDRSDNDFGIYTPDNLYSLNVSLAGSIMQVMQNNGSESLAPGDVVVFNGINRAETAVDAPMIQVSIADTANSTAVAGVVYSRFNIDAVDPDLEFPDDTTAKELVNMDATPVGEAVPGEYVLVVVQGPAEVKATSLGNSHIEPGDLLATSGDDGLAGQAMMVETNGVETAVPGTVFGKALEPLDGKQETIYIYVTLQ